VLDRDVKLANPLKTEVIALTRKKADKLHSNTGYGFVAEYYIAIIMGYRKYYYMVSYYYYYCILYISKARNYIGVNQKQSSGIGSSYPAPVRFEDYRFPAKGFG
jgi:hypothetical protein